MVKTKKIEGLNELYLEQLEGTSKWYFCKECKDSFCDLYEAEEIVNNTGKFSGASCYLVRYPDGKVFKPFELKENVYVEKPVFDKGMIAFLSVDFAKKMIEIFHFNPQEESIKLLAELPLSSVKDCYNLMLKTSPLMLTRDANDGVYEIIWPQKKDIVIGDAEALVLRDGDKLYFMEWYEDPEYHENVVVRDINTGEVLDRSPGSVYRMPDGTIWRI